MLRSFPIGELLGFKPNEMPVSSRTDGLNILHQDQAPTGFQHCTWTMVAEAVVVRQEHQRVKERELDEQYPEPRRSAGSAHGNSGTAATPFRIARKSFLEIAADMASVVHVLREFFSVEGLDMPAADAKLVAKLREQGDSLRDALSSPTFDLEREMLRRDFTHELRGGLSKADLAEAVGGPKRTCEVRRLYELPFHAAFGGGSGAPFAMRYHAEARELRFGREIDYPGATKLRHVFPSATPHLAVATFQPAEHVLRIVPIPEDIRRKRSVMIEVGYDFRARGASVPGLSKGLIADVAGIARAKGFNILSIINKTREFSVREERGKLRVIAIRGEPMEKPAKDRKAISKEIESLAEHWRDTTAPKRSKAAVEPSTPDTFVGLPERDNPQRFSHVSITARCTRPAVHRLFISMKFRHPREANLKDLLGLACAKCGFEPVFAESYSDSATDFVLRKIERCDGFLQILVEPREEQQPRRTWLDFEYGAASGKDLPRMRLVDVSDRPYEKWNEILDIDRDRFSRAIDLSLSDSQVRREFQRAIREIGHRVGRG
ncbi:MAG: hypothetical protein HZB39_16880 [Planctomycetes bacterium]|nr:hypothetical protein [Planctomycetota bacterium]